ncbi:RE1-silencing transcription factor [Portunus trituberculatus]|uniref:RE1-silencing transcription factor n=1 Tax=Portunus trituberculatus TaxID=210409 RepID=A0A5B7FCV4_PORTR|nr:RE1-silencing transcription factor [Portunus trituberculatus]
MTLKEIPEPLPVDVVVKSDSQVKPVDNLILPVDGYWEYTARYGPVGEMFLPENTHLMVALKKEVSVGTPTSRKGKKRQILYSTSTNPSKKPRWDISSSLFRDQKSDTASMDRIEGIHGTSKEDTSESCSGAEKRSLPVSYKGNDNKRLCLDKQNAKSEGTSHYDLFDDDPDLMQITPTLLDVDETITSALPNASALASVLSPPHVSHAVTENLNHKEGTDGIWTSGKHPSGDEKLPFDVTKQSHSGNVIEDDIVLEEMISIAMKTADAEDKLGTENKNQQMSFADTGDVKVKDKLKESVSSCESNQSSVKNVKKGSEVNEDHKRDYSENKATNIKKDQEEQVESSTSDNPKQAEAINTRSEVLKELHVQTKTDNSDNVLKTDGDCEIVSAKKTSEDAKAVNEELSWKTKSSEEFFKIKSEEATQGETRKEEESLELSKKHESDAGTKLDKDSGSGTGIHEDTDDDVASVGRVSTSSFVDDASVVSSEGHDVKTPESQPPKRGRKGKNLTVLPPVECRRVTRGSVVEPLTAEHVEWDDGGIVDLFQCDQCDYFGRHIAHHLVNFHTDRELPCEFKKEDFPPVIKDYVGPPQEGIKEIVALDLSWIPNAMNFDENITCKECDYCSRNRFDLIYHYIEHFPKAGVCSVYHCRLCNYMSEKKENFYNHVSSHTGEYRFRCELCGHKTYKRELLESHHKESHLTQQENFSEAPMIEEDDWLYIYVCKICMFVRISLQEAENHVQQKHGGKADIHKANMRRPIVLHSELRKSGNESDSTPLSRPKYKKKCKKKKGKKLPDLDVFLGEEEEHGDEIEEEAKQLVDRISFNIHTSMSVQEANKRMSLLNSISKKLDEETEEESMEYDPKVGSQAGEESSIAVSSQASPVESKPSTVSEKTSKDKGSEEKTKNETSKDSDKEEKTKDETPIISGGKIINDNARRLKETDSISLESDTESTISAVEPESFEDEVVISGKGSLQDTIKRLSEKLDLSAKEQKTSHQEEEANRTKEQKEKQPVGQCTNSVSAHDNDSDSDTLVICEDADSDKEGETFTDLPQSEESSKQPATIVEPSKISLQDSIQSILREASTKGQSGFPVPKLRILPAHRLIDPQFSPKVRNLNHTVL